MAWSPIDKISYEQLSSTLQAMLNNKTDLSLYNNLNNSFDYHVTSSGLHLTDEDRTKLNYIYDRVSGLLDSAITSNLTNLTNINNTINSHVSNTEVHWSQVDRNNYTVFVNNTNTDLDKFHTHEQNDGIHVTNTDKNNWNKAVSDLASLATRVRTLENLI